MADELTADLFLGDALEATIDEMDVDTLVHLGRAESTLLRLYDAARATPYDMRDLRWYEPDLAGLQAETAKFVEECGQTSATAAGTAGKLAAIAALAPRLCEMDRTAAEEFYDAVKGNVAADQRALFKRGREITKRWRPLARLDLARSVGGAVVDALERLDARYTERKRAEGLLDFSDLERIGLKLLQQEGLRLDYEHVLVDEYQDTNRIQEAILDRLALTCKRFGVGDAKQSIYRFRFADAGIFSDLQERAATYELSGSFRSRPELIRFNNDLFRVMFEGGEVAAQDLDAAADWRDKPGDSVELLLADGDHAAEARRREADALADRLRTIVEKKQLRITNREHEERPLDYGDCAILLRAMSNLAVYERALTQAGVPYVVVMGRGYYAAREVVELAFLLSLLFDPFDRYRATAVMTSLLCGVPEADLLQLPREGVLPTAALRMERPETIPVERWERLVTFANRFERWQDLSMRVDTGDLIEDIFQKTSFPELMLLELDGRRRHANLQKALRRARKSHADPATYARELLEFRERETRESEAPIAAETDRVVQVMTVHAAKGLEFPLVAVADLSWHKTGASGPILKSDGRFGFSFRDRSEVPGKDELKAWNRRQEQDEQRRLLYVAFTRAEEHLILSAGTYPNCDETVLGPLRESPPPGVTRTKVPARIPRQRKGVAVGAAVRRHAPLPDRIERDVEGARALLARVDAFDPARGQRRAVRRRGQGPRRVPPLSEALPPGPYARHRDRGGCRGSRAQRRGRASAAPARQCLPRDHGRHRPRRDCGRAEDPRAPSRREAGRLPKDQGLVRVAGGAGRDCEHPRHAAARDELPRQGRWARHAWRDRPVCARRAAAFGLQDVGARARGRVRRAGFGLRDGPRATWLRRARGGPPRVRRCKADG